jgi:hypothetical protein
VTKTVRPRLELPLPHLAVFFALVLIGMLIRPTCPAEQSGWLADRTPAACHPVEDAFLTGLAHHRDDAERLGDLDGAIRIQRSRIRWYENSRCRYRCDYHHGQRRIDELAELGRLARARHAELYWR